MKTKKTFIKIVALALSLVSLSLFSGCRIGGKNAVYLNAFGSNITIQLGQSAIFESDFTEILNLANSTFDLPDDDQVPDNPSELYNFNQNANYGVPISVSQTFIDALKDAKSYNGIDSKFNPAGYKLSELWHFMPYANYLNATVNNPKAPTDQQVENALANLNFSSLVINEENGTVTKTLGCDKLDLGGMVKGWLVDRLAEKLDSLGDYDGFIQCDASSIRILGGVEYLRIRHPRNDTFSSDAYPDPIDKGSIIRINVTDKRGVNISTSGDYRTKYIDDDGITRCHIIDPSTGKPITTGTSSVTIMGCSATMADALSTALCCYAYDNAKQDDPQGLKRQIERLLSKPQLEGVTIFAISTSSDGRSGYLLTNAQEGTYAVMDRAYKVVTINA